VSPEQAWLNLITASAKKFRIACLSLVPRLRKLSITSATPSRSRDGLGSVIEPATAEIEVRDVAA
jgi:hypothetical protein